MKRVELRFNDTSGRKYLLRGWHAGHFRVYEILGESKKKNIGPFLKRIVTSSFDEITNDGANWWLSEKIQINANTGNDIRQLITSARDQEIMERQHATRSSGLL